MIQEIIETLNQSDEHSSLEVKKGSEIGKSILETICAFSNEPNLGGGIIVLGIEEEEHSLFPTYKVVGVDNIDKIQKDIATQCASTFNQSIRPKITVETSQQRNVILIEVEELDAAMKPVYFKNQGLPKGAYRRIGSTDQRCTEDDLFIFYNKEDSFDSALVEDSDLDDISDEALSLYRRLREKVNPNAEELLYNDIDLLRSLNCIKKHNDQWKLTNCGLIVFGSKMALRRLMPMMRVDYIRVSGKEWVEDPDERFSTTLDLRGPLITLVQRVVSAIADDLPTSFLLQEGKIQAESKWLLPLRVLREAVVNSFIHRSYRVNQPIQIIRYSNRIEIRNAGFSLKPVENIGEPGSVNRNTFIASIFHETNLAETKGTGFGLMQKLMRASDMLPPTFESNHANNSFTLRLLLHNFLNEFDIHWLNSFSSFNLSEEQKMALVFVREVGAIDNSSFRQLCGVTSRDASGFLRDLHSKKLIHQKGQRKSTYYVPGEDLHLDSNGQPTQLSDLSTMGKSLSTMDFQQPTMADSLEKLKKDLPIDLQRKLENLGQRGDKEEVKELIYELCKWRELAIREIAFLINRNQKYIKSEFIKELISEERINYTIPDMVRHPSQKYKAL